MDKRQRIAQQRALAHEALGKLKAAHELFGIEDGAVAGDNDDHAKWFKKVLELENWIFDESPIA